MSVFKTDQSLWNKVRSLIDKDYCQYALSIRVTEVENEVDLFNARESVREIREKVADVSGDSDRKEETMNDLMQLESQLHPKLPPDLRLFKPGWMYNRADQTNARNRSKAFGSLLRRLGSFLANGIEVKNLSSGGCDTNCKCPMRLNVTGDRDGSPRRVPCQQRDHRGMRLFEETMIMMVRFFENHVL
jgi:hypothetical protein